MITSLSPALSLSLHHFATILYDGELEDGGNDDVVMNIVSEIDK